MTEAETLVIRPLAPGDEEAWRPLWAAYLAFYSTTVGDKVYRETFRRLTDADTPSMGAFVAEVEGEMVGLVHYLFHDHCWKLEQVVYLQDLFVSRHQRQRGIGQHLIEAVYKMADEAGCPTVYWLTQDFNVEARALYDRIAEHTPFVKYQRA